MTDELSEEGQDLQTPSDFPVFTRYWLRADGSGNIQMAIESPDYQQGAEEVTPEVFAEVTTNMSTRKWVNGELVECPPPPVFVAPAAPSLFASVGLSILNGQLSTIEIAAQLQGVVYEEGWLLVVFAQPQDAANYLVFAQTDIPAKVDQYKDGGSFELVFTDPATGDPIEPGRIDLQILKVG